MTNHEPWQYEAHVTDEWRTDTMVVQVRQMHRGHTASIGQVLEDRDGMATMMFREPVPDGREHMEPTPGIRLRHDVAVAMARAILTEAGKEADEVERLKALVETLAEDARAMTRELDEARANVAYLSVQKDHLERLVEAKDAHLEREARTSDHFHESLEHARRDERHEQARRHHPSHTVDGQAMEGVAKAARSISDAFRGVNVSRSDLGL